MTTSEYSEDTLVELPTIALFADMHGKTANCYTETKITTLNGDNNNSIIDSDVLSGMWKGEFRYQPILRYMWQIS